MESFDHMTPTARELMQDKQFALLRFQQQTHYCLEYILTMPFRTRPDKEDVLASAEFIQGRWRDTILCANGSTHEHQ